MQARDVQSSWTDEGRPIAAYKALLLRGEASIELLNGEESELRIRMPWMRTTGVRDLRTDVLLLVHDGSYYSAPAYLSVRHLDRLDPITLGIKKSSPLTG